MQDYKTVQGDKVIDKLLEQIKEMTRQGVINETVIENMEQTINQKDEVIHELQQELESLKPQPEEDYSEEDIAK